MKVSFRQLAFKYGLSQSYFTMTKKDSLGRYNFMFSFHEDKDKSLELFLYYIANLIGDMEDLLYSYEDNKNAFSEIIYRKTNLYNPHPYQRNSIYRTVSNSVIKIRETKAYFGIELKVIKKWEQILKLFKGETMSKADEKNKELQAEWLKANKPKYYIWTQEVSKKEFDKQNKVILENIAYPKSEEK